MDLSRRTTRWLLTAGAAVVLAGCGIDVTPPPVSSVKELKHRTLARIDRLEKALAEKKASAGQIKDLAVSVNYLRGHMRTVEVGTDQQQQAFEEILYRLAQIGGAADRPPAHWRPTEDGTPPPQPIIEPGPLRELLPQIREVVESVPDSDLRPNIKPLGDQPPPS